MNSKLFSSFRYTVHVPSFYIQRLVMPDILREGISFVYHPYSQSLIETRLEEARIIKLAEMGFTPEEISRVVGEDVGVVNKTLSELENIIEPLEPREIIDYTKPKALWLLTTPQCNLRCSYCYTSSGKPFGGAKNLATEGVVKVVEKILDTPYKTSQAYRPCHPHAY